SNDGRHSYRIGRSVCGNKPYARLTLWCESDGSSRLQPDLASARSSSSGRDVPAGAASVAVKSDHDVEGELSESADSLRDELHDNADFRGDRLKLPVADSSRRKGAENFRCRGYQPQSRNFTGSGNLHVDDHTSSLFFIQ